MGSRGYAQLILRPQLSLWHWVPVFWKLSEFLRQSWICLIIIPRHATLSSAISSSWYPLCCLIMDYWFRYHIFLHYQFSHCHQEWYTWRIPLGWVFVPVSDAPKSCGMRFRSPSLREVTLQYQCYWEVTYWVYHVTYFVHLLLSCLSYPLRVLRCNLWKKGLSFSILWPEHLRYSQVICVVRQFIVSERSHFGFQPSWIALSLTSAMSLLLSNNFIYQ